MPGQQLFEPLLSGWSLVEQVLPGQTCLVPHVTCLSLVKPREKWSNNFRPGMFQQACRAEQFEPLVSNIVVDERFKGLLGQHIVLETCLRAPQLQSIGTLNRVGAYILARACASAL